MRASTRPLVFIATAVVLVAFALGGWAPVARTIERVRQAPAAPKPATDPGRAQAEKAGIDVDAVVDKVRHRVTPAEDDSGALAAHDESYRARFDAKGFGFTLAEQSSRFGVSLRGVQRGTESLAVVPGAWAGEVNVAVRGLGAGMTERVTARTGELEWDVVLDRPLPGTGGLRIEAELRGVDGEGVRLADHWRFPLDEDGAARMGEVVVKDATGAELHRALPEVRGGVVRLDVPASVLAEARYPLTIDPTLGPELPPDDPVPVAVGGGTPAVAWNGTNFLVVWGDVRSGGIDIYGTRVSGTGAVLDLSGFAIAKTTHWDYEPDVAWNGTHFLVVWQGVGIRGARVSASGTVLEPGGIQISPAGGPVASKPTVAWNGTNFLVAWEHGNFGTDIHGARVSGAGSVLDPSGIPISTAASSDQAEPDAAANGTDFLVVWEDERDSTAVDIYGSRVSGAGSVLDPLGISISTAINDQRWPAVAANGTDYFVVWNDDRAGGEDIYGARLSGAGSVLDPAGIAISTAPHGQRESDVAWNGTDFLVVWQDARVAGYDIYAARVSGAGSVLDPAGILVSSVGTWLYYPAVASNGTDFLVTWNGVYGARVNSAGTVLDPAGILISSVANRQSGSAVAWNGTDFLVVWQDERTGSVDIYGARLSGTGAMLDPAGILISAAANGQYAPDVAWNGTDFLVVWQDGRAVDGNDIYGARVSPAGSVLDPAGIPISTAPDWQYEPAVVSDGTDFLVAWTDFRNDGVDDGVDDTDIYGARVSPAGTVLDPAGIPVSSVAGKAQAAPAVAWNGVNLLVVWTDSRAGANDIYGARVDASGTVLDPTGIAVSTAANVQLAPAVASSGDNFLVVWQDMRSGTSYDIYGAGVGGDGTVAQPAGIPISTAAGHQESPDLAVRYHFLVSWRDRRSGTNYDVYATRVSPAGVVQEPDGFAVRASSSNESAPSVTGGPGNAWGVTYDRFAPEAPYDANRVFFRTVSPK